MTVQAIYVSAVKTAFYVRTQIATTAPIGTYAASVLSIQLRSTVSAYVTRVTTRELMNVLCAMRHAWYVLVARTSTARNVRVDTSNSSIQKCAFLIVQAATESSQSRTVVSDSRTILTV